MRDAVVIDRTGLDPAAVDDEMNEAFAPVPLAWAKAMAADHAKLDPCGGAIALGHAFGSSGVRITSRLINDLETTGGRYDRQTMCEVGGWQTPRSSSVSNSHLPIALCGLKLEDAP